MAEELEVKLSLTPRALNQARQWLLAQPGVRSGTDKTLINTYYDTPAGDLNRRKVALRIRKAGVRYIQTLKTQGEFVDGAHKRQEWEWPVNSVALDLGFLTETPLGNGINLVDLAPVFETNFLRRTLMLTGKGATVECALDEGSIEAAQKVQDLCELELELKEGSADALLSWARELATQVPVFVNLISKAEQGYSLAGLHRPEPLPESEPLVHRVFHGLARAWLNGSTDQSLMADLKTLAHSTALPDQLREDTEWLRVQISAGDDIASVVQQSLRPGQLQLALLSLPIPAPQSRC